MEKGKWKILGVWAMVAFSLFSCEHLILPSELDGSDGQYSIKGTTRSAHISDVTLPVKVYALNGTQVKDSCVMDEEGMFYELILGRGGWKLAAMSAWPTYYGSQQIEVDDDAEVNIVVSPAIAKTTFAIKGINAKSVNVELSGTYKTLRPDGSYSGSTTTTIPLTKNDTAWVGETYVYPTKGKLNINITADDTTYFYAYEEGLLPAYKYQFNGSYESGKYILGWITVGDWAGEKVIDFTFGAQQGADISHLTLSQKTWDGVLSAYSDRPDMADSIASSYEEDGIRGWRIPTREEAKALRNSHPDTQNSDRYLCEGATYTFTWNPSGSITKAGAKAEYKLRLVK